ncbi:MAG: Uma2 family endonuclease [Isosphaeraceae bacterium]
MSTVMEEPLADLEVLTLQDVVDRLGGISLSRILARPAPGTATEADLLAVNARKLHLCELVDGVLVEKAMGLRESLLAGVLIGLLRAFVVPRNLGLVTAPDGSIKIFAGLIRLPDVAFISWSRIPGGRVPSEPVPQLAPELAIEVLSEGNTKAEMRRIRGEYFEAGVDFVWEVDPRKRVIHVYRKGQDKPATFNQSQTIECGATLAGFRLILADLFAELDREQDKPENS